MSTVEPHNTRVVTGTCPHDCPDSCGWEITVTDGRATRIRGAATHPYSAGELCPKVNRLVERIYQPDRILTPLIRTGPKGSAEFRPASWDEALAFVVDNIGRVVADHGGEAITRWSSAGTQGLIQCSSLDRRFLGRLGASDQHGSLCGATAQHGFRATYGSGKGADPMDIVHARHVILWGTNTRLTNRHLWPFITRAREHGAKLVVIDCVRTVTADEADEFICPRPGTDVALAMGMARAIIAEGLVDTDYIGRFVDGFDEFAAAVAEFTPQRVEAETGVAAAVLERLAREYATTRPAMIRTLIGAEHHLQGAMFFRVLGALPLLVGSWRDRGGGLARSVGSWSEVAIDDSVFDVAPPSRSINQNDLGRAMCDPEANVHAVFIWNGNPLVSSPAGHLFRRGLSRDDLFCVVSEQFMTDTAAYADVIFPATTQAEQLDVVASWGHRYLGWNHPAIAPVGDAVPNTELWRRLAAAFGFDDPEFSLTDRQLIEQALHTIQLDDLEAATWLPLPYDDAPLYAQGGFETPSGRAELYSSTPLVPGAALGPAYEPVRVPAEFPFRLLTPKRHSRFLNSTYSKHHGPREAPPKLEMHPQDIARCGLIVGSMVEVYNDQAALRFPLAETDRVAPGVVMIPWGWWGPDRHVNVLTPDTATDWGGGVAYLDAFVAVRAATETGVTA